MISLMGNCLGCLRKKDNGHSKLTLAILGLDNAGKTVTTKGLQGEPLDDVAPTIGFSSAEFKLNNYHVTLYDLGGGKKIRDIWAKYLAEIYGIIYVVDSTDEHRMGECHAVLANLLKNQHVSGKPMLLLANKQDKKGAMDEIEVTERLDLENLVNINKCPCRVETCSATLGKGKKMDKAIKEGVEWLLDTIYTDYDQYHDRVTEDTEAQDRLRSKEKEARAARVRKIREDREREREEKKARGELDSEDESDEDSEDVLDGRGGFRQLDVNELRKKEERLKAKKQAKKGYGNHGFEEDEDDYRRNSFNMRSKPDRSPRTSRSIDGGLATQSDLRLSLRGSPRINSKRSPLAPIGSDRLSRGNLSDGEENTKRRFQNSMFAARPGSPTVGSGKGDSFDKYDLLTAKRNAPLAPLQPLEPLDTYKTKKKKKGKRGQIAPSDSEDNSSRYKNQDSDEETNRISSRKNQYNRHQNQNESDDDEADSSRRRNRLRKYKIHEDDDDDDHDRNSARRSKKNSFRKLSEDEDSEEQTRNTTSRYKNRQDSDDDDDDDDDYRHGRSRNTHGYGENNRRSRGRSYRDDEDDEEDDSYKKNRFSKSYRKDGDSSRSDRSSGSSRYHKQRDEDDDDDSEKRRGNRFKKHLAPLDHRSDRRGYDTPPASSRTPSKASRSPRLSQLNEQDSDSDNLKNKWGLIDELPELSSYSHSRGGPNYNDDIMT